MRAFHPAKSPLIFSIRFACAVAFAWVMLAASTVDAEEPYSNAKASVLLPAETVKESEPKMETSSENNQQPLAPDDLEQRGKHLRVAIDKKYKELSAANKLLDDTDVTSVVTQYIPIGTSFDDTKKILSGAGFKVSFYTIPNSPKHPYNEYGLTVEIMGYSNPYLSWLDQPIGTKLSIGLSTRDVGENKKVSAVGANFISTDI